VKHQLETSIKDSSKAWVRNLICHKQAPFWVGNISKESKCREKLIFRIYGRFWEEFRWFYIKFSEQWAEEDKERVLHFFRFVEKWQDIKINWGKFLWVLNIGWKNFLIFKVYRRKTIGYPYSSLILLWFEIFLVHNSGLWKLVGEIANTICGVWLT